MPKLTARLLLFLGRGRLPGGNAVLPVLIFWGKGDIPVDGIVIGGDLRARQVTGELRPHHLVDIQGRQKGLGIAIHRLAILANRHVI